MEYAEIKDWLDAIVDSIEHQRTIACFNSQISMANPHDFVLISGIHFVADLMEIPLNVEYVEMNDKFKYFFEYRGIEFYDFYPCRLEDLDAGADRKSDGC